MNNNKGIFSLESRIQSIRHAIDGLIELVRGQHNAWIHLLATIVVIIAGIWFKVSIVEWCLLVIVIAFVWVTEALNTSLEYLCDVASPEFHPLVKKTKDIAAAAVLLSALAAIIVGLLIFLPYVAGRSA